MRKLLLATLLFGALTAAAQGYINPQVRMLQRQHQLKVAKARTRGQVVNEKALTPLFVTCDKDANALQVAQSLRELGAKIVAVKGHRIALGIPMSQIEAMAATPGVAVIDGMPKVDKKTDVTRSVTQAAEVNDGSAPKLPQAYTGKGVVIGLLDGGFDYTHPMFKDKDGNLRIKGAYTPGNSKGGDEKLAVHFSDGSSEDLIGTAFSKPENILDTLKLVDRDGSHGTHTASTAAGSIMSDVKGTAGNPLGGIAPEADILLVNTFERDEEFENQWGGYDTDFIALMEGLYYLEQKAQDMNQPLVASMSVGSHIGWHDGTSGCASMIGEFCKEDHLAFMVAAGNEGNEWEYVDSKISGGDSVTVGTIPVTTNYVWGGMKTQKKVMLQVGLYNWKTKVQVCEAPIALGTDGKLDTSITIDFEDSENPDSVSKICYDLFKPYFKSGTLYLSIGNAKGYDQNDKPYKYTELFCYYDNLQRVDESDDAPRYAILMKIKPEEDTELHAWGNIAPYLFTIGSDKKPVKGASDVSMNDWVTSGEPVSVGAWCANGSIQYEGTSAQDTGDEVGAISYFSSYGTDLAGHKHPDVTAPGSNLVAGFNSFDPDIEYDAIYQRKGYKNQYTGQTASRDYFYGTMSGTSMATPAMAGVAALWMQAAKDKGKTLSSADIKDIIAHACDTDFPKQQAKRFGAGKVNAYKGLLYVLDLTSIQGLSQDQPSHVTFRVSGDLVYADGAEDGTIVTVYNLSGVNVLQTTVQGGTISLAGLPKGVYALQLGKLGSTLVRK